MPISPLPLNPEKAIWEKDVSELARALNAGWRLPSVFVKDGGMVRDMTLANRVISLRWTQGWRLLTQHMPELHAEPVLWQLALKRGVPGIVASFLEHGQSATRLLERGIYPLHLVAEGFGPVHGEPIPEEEQIETVRVLVAAGAQLEQPCPGNPVGAGSRAMAGHVFWTRMIHFERWSVAETFLPSSWEALRAWHWGDEAISSLRRAALPGKDPAAARLWRTLLRHWALAWLTLHPQENLTAPAEIAVIPELPVDVRPVLWERWNIVDDMGWTALHDLALCAKQPEAREVLALAHRDQAACLAHWTRRDPEGVRPCDLWEMALGRDPAVLPEHPPLPI